MSWREAEAVTRRWADLSDAAARDRGVSADRLEALKQRLEGLPDKKALYVYRNEVVARVLHRLADIFARRDTMTGDELDRAITISLDPTEPG